MKSRVLVGRLWVLMTTVGIDMIGFLIVLPLLPFYAEKLGASPFLIGAMVSIFAFAQLASAPIWGRISDRYGRRPVILSSLLVSAAAFLLFESADTIALLFFSRLVQGFGGGTVAVVQAYLSDSVPPEDRAKGLGWITAASSAGVMLGPAIGSLTATYGSIGPGHVAAILCLCNFAFAFRWLPEPIVERSAGGARGGGNDSTAEAPAVPTQTMRQAFLQVVQHPTGRVGSLVWIYASGMMAFMASNAVLALYFAREFGVTEATIGWFYVYVGGLSLVMRALVLGPMIDRFGEVGLLKIGQVSLVVGLVAITLATNLPMLALAVPFIPIGTAFLFPATTSLLSAAAPKGQTGLVLGVQQSFGGMSRMIGPLWAGAAFQAWGTRSPFWIAAALVLLFRLFATVVRDPRTDSDKVPVEAAPDPDLR